ncbi:MAG: hypothetical protein QMC80_05940 [Thermoplasmatales archaeon]|nr:hypothetical protein [Thermoplasmatales archaeon]
MDYSDVCCIIIFIILVIIWIARQISKAKREKEARVKVQPGYKPYGTPEEGFEPVKVQPRYEPYKKTAYRIQETTVRPEYRYKPPYQMPHNAYESKFTYIQPRPEKTVCRRCSSDDLKFFESGYVKCNKCGYYYYDGSKRIEHRK